MGLTANNVPKSLWEWLEKQDGEIDIEKVSISLYDQRPKHERTTMNQKDYQLLSIVRDDGDEEDDASLKKQVKRLQTENKALKNKIKIMNKKRKLNAENEKQPLKKRKYNTSISDLGNGLSEVVSNVIRRAGSNAAGLGRPNS